MGPIYVLGDSIAYGLAHDRLALRLRKIYGSAVKINFDSGRSITEPGSQVKRSALQAIEDDSAFIAKAQVIVVILGTNQTERSFANSQLVLLSQLKALAPDAHYFWVDIGATLANQAQAWSARNQVIYANAGLYGYTVISRYRAIFGPEADPLAIAPGRNFPGMGTEPGFGSEGNVHGADPQLGEALLQALADVALPSPACVKPAARTPP